MFHRLRSRADIEEIKVAVRQSSVDQRGSGVDDKPQVRGLLWQARTRCAGRHSGHYILFGLFRTPHRDNARMVGYSQTIATRGSSQRSPSDPGDGADSKANSVCDAGVSKGSLFNPRNL
jgi:hypothetical protein